MGACQARRRPARERRCSPTVIINLRPGHLREPGQPRPCRLPFYVPVLSTAENGAHGSPGARTEGPVLTAPPGLPAAPAPARGKPEPGAPQPGAAGQGLRAGGTHTHTVACTISRAHSDTVSRVRAPARTDCKSGGLVGATGDARR